MSKAIYKLFMDYKGRELDDSFINQAYELMMEDEKALESHIKGLFINPEEGKNLADYNWGSKLITIYKPNVIGFDDDRIPDKKLQILRILKHEIEHARNYKKLHEGRQDIESTIIKYSLDGYPDENGLNEMEPHLALETMIRWGMKKENYLIDPEERLADIRAGQYLVNLLKSQRNTPELLMARSLLFYSYIRGYKHNGYYLDPPTYQFLLKMGMYHEHYLLKKRVEEKSLRFPAEPEKEGKYTFDTRLTYGLPISQKEFDEEIPNKVRLLVKIKK